jgi:hypothetical protein
VLTHRFRQTRSVRDLIAKLGTNSTNSGTPPSAVRGAAMRSLLAGLEKLAEEGLASVTAEGHWQLAA